MEMFFVIPARVKVSEGAVRHRTTEFGRIADVFDTEDEAWRFATNAWIGSKDRIVAVFKTSSSSTISLVGHVGIHKATHRLDLPGSYDEAVEQVKVVERLVGEYLDEDVTITEG